VRASRRLLKVYCQCDRAPEAVAQLSVLCGISGADPRDAHPWASSGGWPDWLFTVAAQLVCKFGLAAAFGAAGKLPEACTGYRHALAELLRAVQEAGVDGVNH